MPPVSGFKSMKHLPLVTKSRAKPPPSRPPPPTLLFMLSLRPVLISQRINRARATEKKKFYRVATRIGIFPPPPASLLPLRGNVDRDADPLGRWRPRFRCSIRRRSSQSVAHPSLRYSPRRIEILSFSRGRRFFVAWKRKAEDASIGRR